MNKKKIIFIIIFSIVLIAGLLLTLFKEEKVDYNPEPIEVDYVKKNYKYNEYKVISVEKLDVVNNYYNSYLNLLLNNQEKLFEKLTDTNKNKFDKDFSKFKDYIKKIITSKTKNAKVEKYDIQEFDNSRIITIIDSENNKVIFHEKAVNVYQIEID